MKNFLLKYKNGITSLIGFAIVLQPVAEWFVNNTDFTLEEFLTRLGIAVIGYFTGKPKAH